MKTTITEALAELATLDKRLPKKAADMLPYVARLEQIKDPFVKTGGSEKYLAEQRQSFSDLQVRKIMLRSAIAKANAETVIEVAGRSMSVADWLVWKRECYAPYVSMLKGLLGQAQGARAEAQKRGVALVTTNTASTPEDIVVNVDEQGLVNEIDGMEEVYGRLDGLLSLKNATTMIEV